MLISPISAPATKDLSPAPVNTTALVVSKSIASKVASISFLIRNLGNDKNYKKEFIIENEIKLREEIRKLNDYLFEEQNETSSYLYRAFEDYIDMDSEEEDVCRSKRRKRDRELQKKKYESLVKKVNLKLPNTRTISEERLKEFVEKYLTEIIENTELIYSILDDPVQMKNIYSLVESRTNEIKRMVINSSISYLYNVSISDEFDFSKRGNRALKYSELRLLAILRKKAQDENIIIDDSILSNIANKIDSNIRELEGVFNKIVARASLTHSPITIELAENIINEFKFESEKVISCEFIKETIAKYFSINKDDLAGNKRSNDIAFPRQIAMYLCREIANMSYPQIGEDFGGRDHSTVMHACRKIEKEIKEKSNTKLIVDSVKNIIIDGKQ